MLIAHAGNRIDEADRTPPRFPTEQIAAVSAVLRRALATFQPSGVVSAPANGADLIVLAQAVELGIAIHVVLPLPREDFLARSVRTDDPWWAKEFERLLACATAPGCSVEQLDLGADPDWYLTTNGLVLERARSLAGRAEPVVALTVRPPGGEMPPSATDDFAGKAMEAGLTVLTLDARPRASGSIVVQ